MDQEQYAKQHDYLSRMAEVPTKLVTLDKELDLLHHHVADLDEKLRMLDDLIIKAREIEKRLGNIQYFLADDVEPTPTSPRDEIAMRSVSDFTSDASGAEGRSDYPLMTAPRGGIKYGRTV